VNISFFSPAGTTAQVPLEGLGPQSGQQLVVHPRLGGGDVCVSLCWDVT
jgi:hypothetical protein